MKAASIFMLLLAAVAATVAQSVTTPSTRPQNNFITVEGPDLKSRVSDASRRGSAQRGRYWLAYSFDVKPGVAFDVLFTGSRGASIVVNGSTVSSPFETRNLGVFLLHENAGLLRGEIYNLDRPRDYAGYPVYWLGRAASEESLTLLRGMVDTVPSHETVERLVDAIGAHDAPGVAPMLKDLIRTAKSERARTTAVSWLGQLPGQVEFLATLVRDERTHPNVRREAAETIGDSGETSALTVLQDLYRAVTHREVKQELLEAIADERFDSASIGFLIQTLEQDPDRELRAAALEGLSAKSDARSFEALEKAAFNADGGVELQQSAVEGISERFDTQALPLLKKIARSHPRRDVRQEALERLGERPEQLPFLRELANDRGENLDVRRAAIEAIAESENGGVIATLKQLFSSANHRKLKETLIESIADSPDRAEAIRFLLDVARSESDGDVRESALSALGEMNDERAIDALLQFYDAARDEQTKGEVLDALSEADSPRALQKLIAVAQRDPIVKLRKRAIELIGESDDPVAIKFLERLIK